MTWSSPTWIACGLLLEFPCWSQGGLGFGPGPSCLMAGLFATTLDCVLQPWTVLQPWAVWYNTVCCNPGLCDTTLCATTLDFVIQHCVLQPWTVCYNPGLCDTTLCATTLECVIQQCVRQPWTVCATTLDCVLHSWTVWYNPGLCDTTQPVCLQLWDCVPASYS